MIRYTLYSRKYPFLCSLQGNRKLHILPEWLGNPDYWAAAFLISFGTNIGQLIYYKSQKWKSDKDIIQREMSLQHRTEILKDSEKHFEEKMERVAQQALISNNESFLKIAKVEFDNMSKQAHSDFYDMRRKQQYDASQMLEPLNNSMKQVQATISEMERGQRASHSNLKGFVDNFLTIQKDLRSETENLSRALRSPTGRGQWGEMQLRRAIEMTGMIEHCDFEIQPTVSNGDTGGTSRPDVVVKLAGNRKIVVDAKTPLSAYLEAFECTDKNKQQELMKEHAKSLRSHINSLSQKSYWAQFEPSPNFVVLFVPGESIFGAALSADPTLIEHGGI